MNKRLQIRRHNAMLGSAAMMKGQCAGILASQTATDETKRIATQIQHLARELYVSLKTRKPFPDEEG